MGAAGRGIARAEVFVVRAPIDPPSGVSIGLATWHEYLLVRLEDGDGAVGWGETYLLPGLPAVAADLTRMLLGADPGAVRLHARTLASTAASSYVRSAIMIALDDLRARRLDVPVHALYGGPTRTDVRAYAASQGYVADRPPEETWPADVAEYLAAGYRAIKLRVGRYPIEREAAILRELVPSLPAGTEFMVDGNGAYVMGTALRMGAVLEELGARWFEEPLPQHGYPGYPELAAQLTIDLAGGEILENARDADRLLAAHGVDVVQPDVVICGGIAAALEIADLAAVHGIPVVPHTSGGALGITATLHLLACLADPNAAPASPKPLLEFGQGPNPWRTDLLEQPLTLVDGAVAVPTGPGLGVTVDEAFVRRSASQTLEVA